MATQHTRQNAAVSVEDTVRFESIWAVCHSCNKVTVHRILSGVEQHDESPEGDIEVWDYYRVVQCQGCHEISFLHESSCTEDMEYDPITGQESLKVTRVLYPSRVAGRSKLSELWYLPQEVRKIYEESHAALCSGLPVMAGFGVRAIVEAVCVDKGVVGHNLVQKIDALAAANHITHDGARILHSIRTMGNNAVHDLRAHSEEELGAAFDVVEYLLNGVYFIPQRAERLLP